VNAHSLSANAAYDPALQKRRAFALEVPRRPRFANFFWDWFDWLFWRFRVAVQEYAKANVRGLSNPDMHLAAP